MVWIAGISMVALSWNAMTDAISAATMGTIWLLDIARAGTGRRFRERRLAHDDRPLAQCRRRNAVEFWASYSVLGSQTCELAVVVTLIRVHDDPDFDDELADESEEDDAAIEDENAHTLSIRRATGEELLTVFSPNEEWSVYVQPGGAITSAFVGTPSDPVVWVNATDRRVERDEDGTYVIRID